MNEHLKDPFFDYHQHLKVLPDHVLRDIARNDCADRDYRRQAVEILVVRKSVMANHPELSDLKAELDVELEGLQFEYPDPEEEKQTSGPLVASVTTKTMFSDPPKFPEDALELIEATSGSTEVISGADIIVPISSTDLVPHRSSHLLPRSTAS